jgi:hypothetical protein
MGWGGRPRDARLECRGASGYALPLGSYSQNGVASLWATQILPFADPTSFGGYMDFETAAYATQKARAAA